METKNILEELYDLFQEKTPCWMDDMEILKAKKELETETFMDDTDKENAVLNYGIAYEKAGFRYVFLLAVRIMAQCINEVPVSIL